MRVGDLVRHTFNSYESADEQLVGIRVGLVIDMIQKKCWRTSSMGQNVSWDNIKPEAHAVVMYPQQGEPITIPASDLEVVNNESW